MVNTGYRHLMQMTSAQVGFTADGAVTFADPGAPLTVRVWTDPDRLGIRRIRVDARPGAPRLTAAALGRLPVAAMLRVARSGHQAGTGHPNDMLIQLYADQRPGRSWDDDHWGRVLDVYTWAETSNRPGGGVQAIADMWGVTIDPTAYRWLREARRRVDA